MLVEADGCFEALADPVRRRVVELLGEGPRRAGDLARSTDTTAATMSRHLRVLLRQGLVEDERLAHDARVRVFQLRPEPFVALQAWLDQVKAHWSQQLGAFRAHVERAPK